MNKFRNLTASVLYDGEYEQYSFTLNTDDTVNFYINNKYMDTVDDLDISKGLLVAAKELLNCWECKVLKIEAS